MMKTIKAVFSTAVVLLLALLVVWGAWSVSIWVCEATSPCNVEDRWFPGEHSNN